MTQPAPSSLCTLWLLPDGRVRAHRAGRTHSPVKGAIRLAASLHPQELALVWRLFVNGSDGERHCLEAVLVRSRAARPFSRLTRKHRETMARSYRAAIRRLRAGEPAFDEGTEPVASIALAIEALDMERAA